MTIDEIKEMKENFKHNELYQKSCSPFKDFQFEQFSVNNEILTGTHERHRRIGDIFRTVLFRFNDFGLLHSENDLPAIEYQGHMEYWKDGVITRVVDVNEGTEELWEDGVPIQIHIDNTLSEKN